MRMIESVHRLHKTPNLHSNRCPCSVQSTPVSPSSAFASNEFHRQNALCDDADDELLIVLAAVVRSDRFAFINDGIIYALFHVLLVDLKRCRALLTSLNPSASARALCTARATRAEGGNTTTQRFSNTREVSGRLISQGHPRYPAELP